MLDLEDYFIPIELLEVILEMLLSKRLLDDRICESFD